MKLSNIKKNYPILLVSLIIAIIIMICLIYFMVIPFENLHPNQSNEIPQTSVPSNTTSQTNDYCYIQEVDPDYITNRVIVHLTKEDLISFPQVENGILNYANNDNKWYNGRKFVYDFKGSVNQITELRNLSCKNSTDPKCDPLESPVLYEYDGQFFAIGCLPEFGKSRPTVPSPTAG
ncbi:hypothetical protein [Methanoplanus limicola]|uniref:Uncharacterized protein n=1 Tax=Methanoplanus limicola DSM 2279 TaxID=937775 RepID=H1Z3G7_9EURY|nr:hypothetical protein [Methanoplanus limicola]EHQ34762.1 hypothetical protein Metlim_0637 [Methanoplanus limicola DSM 2279]